MAFLGLSLGTLAAHSRRSPSEQVGEAEDKV